MSTTKRVFAKLSAQEPMKVELFDAREAVADRDKAANGSYAAYQMIQKAKASVQKSIFACDAYISKYVKELDKWPANSPTVNAYKKAIDAMKAQKKGDMDFLATLKKIPTF